VLSDEQKELLRERLQKARDIKKQQTDKKTKQESLYLAQRKGDLGEADEKDATSTKEEREGYDE